MRQCAADDLQTLPQRMQDSAEWMCHIYCLQLLLCGKQRNQQFAAALTLHQTDGSYIAQDLCQLVVSAASCC